MSNDVIVIGGGGHAKVVIEALRARRRRIVGIADADPARVVAGAGDIPVIGDDEAVLARDPDSVELAFGVGGTGPDQIRHRLYDRFSRRGFRFVNVVHPSAIVALDVELGEGAQIMAGAVIQPACRIGRGVIINTHASVDHDCRIGDFVHLAPGVTLSGGVVVGERSHIGTGVNVIQNVTIGENALVAAGSTVVQDVESNHRVTGPPGRPNSGSVVR